MTSKVKVFNAYLSLDTLISDYTHPFKGIGYLTQLKPVVGHRVFFTKIQPQISYPKKKRKFTKSEEKTKKKKKRNSQPCKVYIQHPWFWRWNRLVALKYRNHIIWRSHAGPTEYCLVSHLCGLFSVSLSSNSKPSQSVKIK